MNGLPRLTVTAAVAVLLTAFSLQPTLQNGSWMLPTILCVAVVAGVGYGARRLRAPRFVIPILQVATLGVVLVLRFAQDVAVWGVLPGRAVLVEAQSLLDEASSTITTYSSPAPVTPGLVFLLAMSVALVAIVVDTVAVTYRSPALAGLPLLVLYAVPVSVVSNGVSWIYFGIAATGWLALLLADGRERLGGWGRRLGTRAYAGDPTAGDVPVIAEPLGAVGRRIGVASVALAVLIPAIVPGLSEAVFGNGVSDGTGTGGSKTVSTVNPFVSLGSDLNRPKDTVVLTYTTSTNTPDYLRLVTLDTFDGTNWLPSSLESSGRVADGALPSPPGLSDSTSREAITTDVQTAELVGSTWLPAPYPVSAVTIQGDTADDWVWDSSDRVVWSPDGNDAELQYSVESLAVKPTRGQLNSQVSLEPNFVGAYTALPLTIPDLVRETAKEVTAGAVTPYQRAVALQDWFQDPQQFRYDSSTPSTQVDPLTEFLNSRRGFCQQFAGTFAVMARSLQLPTRVVVGFVPGERTQDGTWKVSWHDTHAWPEVYFEGVGWVRFEPTPRAGAGLSIPAWTIEQAEAPGGERPEVDRNDTPGARPSTGPRALPGGVAPSDRDRDKLAQEAAQQNQFPWVWLLVPAAVLTLLLLPWAIRLGQRRRRLAEAKGPDPRLAASAAWTELTATCADLDLAWPKSRTPRQVSAALITERCLGAPAADALRRLGLSTERARYSLNPAPVLGLADDVRVARAGLREAATRQQRVRASLAPASLLSRLSNAAADTLDFVDSAPGRARRAVRPGKARESTSDRIKTSA